MLAWTVAIRCRTQCDRDFEHSQHISSSAHVSSLVAELLRSRGKLERPVSCFSVARCTCNISTSFCCTTVCLSLTMWTDSHTQLNSFSRNFQTSLGIMVSEGKIIIIIIIIIKKKKKKKKKNNNNNNSCLHSAETGYILEACV